MKRPLPKDGFKKRFTNRQDYDFHKTFGSAAFNTATLPPRYIADIGLTMPDQNGDGYPVACTGYASCDVCTNEDGVIYDGPEFWKATPPYDPSQGRDVRESMKLLTKRGPKTPEGELGPKRTGYFNVRSTPLLPWFDSVRVALWITRQERRAASIAVPWFPEFQEVDSSGIAPASIIFDWKRASGHNAVVAGWTDVNTKGKPIRNGEVFLAVKSWQGTHYGDNGWVYWPAPLVNAIFEMYYTEVFTVSKFEKGKVQTIDLPAIEWLVAFMRDLVEKAQKLVTKTPPPPIEPPKDIYEPPPMPIQETLAEKIVEAAKLALNTDPTSDDKIDDSVACVASLVAVLPEECGISRNLTYTPDLEKALRGSEKFKETKEMTAGCVVVYVTVGNNVGHALICLEDDDGTKERNTLASNNSFGGVRGLFTLNYSRGSARKYFLGKGLKGFIFRPIN